MSFLPPSPALPSHAHTHAHQLDRIPSVTFDSGDDKFYTLLLLDPDFLADRSVMVAMVINIPGEDGDAAVGDAVWPFIPPGDVPGHTGTHR